MTGKDPDDIERFLARLAPKSVPPGLRQKVMASALIAREKSALTPRMRIVAIICSFLIIASFGVDSLIGRHESAQIAIFFGDPGVSAPAADEEEVRLLWAEFGGDLGDIDKFLRGGIVLSRPRSRGGQGWHYLEAREWLKGMIDHEDPENYY